jgi:hypothetical protein
VLEQRGRRVLRAHLARDSEAGLAELKKAAQSALR